MESIKLTLLALKFPELATFCYETTSKVTRAIQGLSPSSRKNLLEVYNKTKQIVGIVMSYLISIYPTLLHFNEISIQDWREPNSTILGLLASWILFWFPVRVSDDHKRNSQKLIYVGNQQVYSFGTLNLLAYNYQKDKVLLRTVVDQFHFKIPIWKQILEYFGCVSESPENFELLASLGHPILIFPGGFNEFSKFNPDYSLDFNPKSLTLILEIASRYSYSLVPFGNVGGTDMYNCLVTLPYSLNLDTLPILIPSSYQRQYLTLQKETTYTPKIPVYLELVQDITKNVQNSKQMQHLDSDSKRYLLLFLHKINVKIQERFLQKDGVIVRGIDSLTKRARRGVESVIKMGIKQFSETPGPIIEELEE